MYTLIIPTIFLGFFPNWLIDFLWNASSLIYLYI
jgi:hypothetical protein